MNSSMLFNSIEYIVFITTILLLVLYIRTNIVRKRLLLIASYYFYSYWDWRFAIMLMVSSIIDFIIGRKLEQTSNPKTRKYLLATSILVNLGILGFFKYAGFFVESAGSFLSVFGLKVGTLSVLLPVGISFFTFQKLSYTIDIYRGKLKSSSDFFDYALFVAFFPQLVAGPIVRASEFLPQLTSARQLNWSRAFFGFQQFVFGLTKKVLIADRLAEFVDPVFENIAIFDGPTLWIAALAYTAQIYCDFSGYSDMAIGTAKVLGYDLPVNFRHPYTAASPSEFWRRWHISLSTWLRDYLYIPLGGNRCGQLRTYSNLMITMLLGGLWHGAAWTFIAWGALHGLALTLEKIYTGFSCRIMKGKLSSKIPAPFSDAIGWILTLLIVIIGWIIFRAQNFKDAFAALSTMFTFASNGVSWLSPYAIIGILFTTATHVAYSIGFSWKIILRPDRLITPTFLFILIWMVVAFHPKGNNPFIYFQF